MSIKNAQTALGVSPDGAIGPKTIAAARSVLTRAGVAFTAWSNERIVLGAAQAVLAAASHEPGHVDGYWGHNSQNAFDAWEDARAGRPALVLDRGAPTPYVGGTQWPRQKDMVAFYGPPGGPRATTGTVRFPFAHKLAWNTSDQVATFKCHDLTAAAFQSVFDQAAKHYGEAEYRRLRLDLFGGCYNPRKMRGGSSWSMHAWGVAVDLDPDRNGLKMSRDQASFARPEYEPFWRIVEGQGLVSLGRLKNFDWMHFQGARL
jgi:peptidoglycan hydrolase-like protein with peptidoglycan-binding domain